MDTIAKKTVSQLQTAIQEAEVAHCPAEDLAIAYEALEAVQAILSPDERKVPLDEQSRRRSLAAKRRSLSLKHVKSSTSSSGSGSLPLV